MKVSEIGYRDDIIAPYMKAIQGCQTVDELRRTLAHEWEELCPDALAQSWNLTDEQWTWVLAHKKQKRYAEKVTALAGALLLPELLLTVGMLAMEFHVPDGCAYHRMMDVERKG